MFRNHVSSGKRSTVNNHGQKLGRFVVYAAPVQPLTLHNTASHQHPSVARYFKSLSDDDAPWSGTVVHSEPGCARDVEVLVVHRQASYQDIVRSKDKTYRKLLDLFDWDAMKMPVAEESPQEFQTTEEEYGSGEETDSADESGHQQTAHVIAYPKAAVFRFDEHSVVRLNVLVPPKTKQKINMRFKHKSKRKVMCGRDSMHGTSFRTITKG